MTDANAVLHMLHNASAKQADIAFALGIPIRKVQEGIVELRLAGHPIVTDGDGVSLAQNADEVRACAESLRRRLVAQYQTLRALRRTAKRMAEEEARQDNLTLWREAIA